MAISTTGVTLKRQTSADPETYEKLVDIKSFPDMGAAPTLLETTTLSDDAQTFINGVQAMAAMEFLANYTTLDFNNVVDYAGIPQVYRLEFGVDGVDGIFEWSGEHTVLVVGGGINAVVDMKIVITPSTAVEKVAS